MKLWILVGTRAEYIKIAPLLNLLDAQDTDYDLVDTGQHIMQTRRIRGQFSVREPDLVLVPRWYGSGVLAQSMWLLLMLAHIVLATPRRYGLKAREQRQAIIHGDTLSTLVSLLLARRLGFKVAHIESGLSSHSLLEPFPEEFVRRMVTKLADVLLAPSPESIRNLNQTRPHGKVFSTHGNTGFDSCVQTLKATTSKEEPIQSSSDYCIAALHRLENLFCPWRLNCIIRTLIQAATSTEVILIAYENTIRRLNRSRFGRVLLSNARVRLEPLMEHSAFLKLMVGSKFIITDGGSIQEECSYLGVPCLLLRNRTERSIGLGKNVRMLAPFPENIDKINAWLFSQDGINSYSKSPSTSEVSPTHHVYRTLHALNWFGVKQQKA